MAKETKKATTVEEAQFDWSKEATTGFETVTGQDLGIPFLMILQALSPQVNRADPNYANAKIVGAQPGTIINTISKEVYHQPDEAPVVVIPCGYDKRWVEWRARTSGGGGFVKAHSTDAILQQCHKNEKGQDELPNGNIVMATAYFFVIVTEANGIVLDPPVRAVIGMSSTQLRNARQWLNVMSGIKFTREDKTKFTPPMFSHYYALSVKPESNEKGSWMGWKIETAGQVKDVKLIDNARIATQETIKQARALLNAPAKEEDDAVPFA